MKCPSCGAAEEAGARFCRACGTELVSRSTISSEGERRQVTVLFSDLSGYTSLCEKVDPEEVREIMDRIFGNLTPIVESYGGSVDKYLGDGTLILFGAKVAHEDDPVRAVKTALDIHRAVESIGRGNGGAARKGPHHAQRH